MARKLSLHAAVCTFGDRDTAERAREHLVHLGFPRSAVHVGHAETGEGAARTAGEAPGAHARGRDVAPRPNSVLRLAASFLRLLQRRYTADAEPAPSSYSGSYVLVVDALDEQEARRAHAALNGWVEMEDAVERREAA